MGSRTPKWKIKRIKKRLSNGDSVNVIKLAEGVSAETVRKIRNAEGIPAKPHGCSIIVDYSAIDRALADGWCDDKIANTYHRTAKTVRKRRTQLGIAKYRHYVTQQQKEEVIRLGEDPRLISMSKIATAVGLSDKTVNAILNKSTQPTPRSTNDQAIQTVRRVPVAGSKARAVQDRKARKVAGSK